MSNDANLYKNDTREAPTAEVVAMGKLNFTGNVIPHTWRDYIRKSDNRAKSGSVVDLEGTVILAWIVWWYRPADVIDEETRQWLGWKKKFWGDKLQASYSDIAEQTGLTKLQTRAAIERLEAAGIITTEFRHTPQASNVLYIGINVEKIIEISYPCAVITKDGCAVTIQDDMQYLLNTYTKRTTETQKELLHSSPAVAGKPKNNGHQAVFALPLDQAPPLVESGSEIAQSKPRALTEQQQFYKALCEVCHVDGKVMRGQVVQAVKTLRSAGYSLAQVEGFADWWKVNDWRGQKGQPPTVQQLIAHIKQSVDALAVATPVNGKSRESVPQNIAEAVDENFIAMLNSQPAGSYLRQIYAQYL